MDREPRTVIDIHFIYCLHCSTVRLFVRIFSTSFIFYDAFRFNAKRKQQTECRRRDAKDEAYECADIFYGYLFEPKKKNRQNRLPAYFCTMNWHLIFGMQKIRPYNEISA